MPERKKPVPNSTDLLQVYRMMLLTRGLNERLASLYRRGKIQGGVYSGQGQEAIAVGTAWPLRAEDVLGPMIRDAGAILTKGMPIRELLAHYMGRTSKYGRGRENTTHIGSLELNMLAPTSLLSSLIPICAGAALSFKLRGEKRVALTYIGDGGSSLGDFHEGLNFAAVMNLPFVLVLENNGYAYSTPTRRQSRLTDFAEKAKAYGIEGITADGNDILKVLEVTGRAIEKARDGGGPTLVEFKTFRMKGHAEHDDAAYVPKELFAEWKEKDPIARLERVLTADGKLDAATSETFAAEIKVEMDEAEEWALAQPHAPAEEAAMGVYAGGDGFWESE